MEVGIGIDMGGTRIKIGLVSKGTIVAASVISASAHVTLEERLEQIADHIDAMLTENNCTPRELELHFQVSLILIKELFFRDMSSTRMHRM